MIYLLIEKTNTIKMACFAIVLMSLYMTIKSRFVAEKRSVRIMEIMLIVFLTHIHFRGSSYGFSMSELHLAEP